MTLPIEKAKIEKSIDDSVLLDKKAEETKEPFSFDEIMNNISIHQ